MKILLLLSHVDQTGMTTNTLALGQALVKLGNSVTLLVGGGRGNILELSKLHQKFVDSGVDVVLLPQYSRSRGMLALHSKLKFFLSAVLFIATHHFDVIHVESPYLSFIPWILHKRFVSTLHVNSLVKCFYYKNATRLIAISRETKDYAKRVFGYKDKEIDIVYHGVPLSFSTLITNEQKVVEKRKLNIPTDKLIIGLVGSIEKRKGHDILLHALSLLPEDILSTIHVIFLGSSKDGRTNEWLSSLIKETKMENIVSRFEYHSSKPFYKLFDIFVLPSRLEGFPLVVIEAMLSGCCCVRSNVEGAYDQIEDGKNGLLFENENVEQLSSIIRYLIEHPDKRKELASAGKETALEKFTSETMAKKTLEVYKKVINGY